MVTVFVSYSHADEELRQQLDVHLSALRRQGIVEVWHDRAIGAGDDFAEAIDAAIKRADIILLLVSPDFIASPYCYDVEMQEAMRRSETGEAVAIPVILRACEWHDLPFGRLRATPTDGKPIRLFPDLDSAFLEVVRDIKAAALTRGSDARQTVLTRRMEAQPALTDPPRSGNLRVRKAFTDYDRDQYRTTTFDYVSRYFQNSLGELEKRHPEIRTSFRALDATSFEAAAYDARGRQRTHCGVWLGNERGFGGDIGYSNRGVGQRNSYNEILTIGDDGTSLGFRLDLSFRHNNDKKLLSQEGAAEHLWSTFIEPLQE